MAKRLTTQAPKAGGRGKSAVKTSAVKTSVVKTSAEKGVSDSLDAHIEAAATLLTLTLDPAWIPTVRANLQTILGQAALVTAFELSDEAEPAPVFRA
jgi:hypothetical protein